MHGDGDGTVTDRPTVGAVAERTYEALAPLAYADEANGWALLLLTQALVYSMETPDSYVREYPDLGLPTFGILLDVDNAPPEVLDWMGQFAGKSLVPGQTTEQSRQRIRSTSGFDRGAAEAFASAALPYLVDNPHIIVRERYRGDAPGDQPGYVQVRTYAAETLDVNAARAALEAELPGGLIMDYQVVAGQDWQSVVNTVPTWSALQTKYATWAGVIADISGT